MTDLIWLNGETIPMADARLGVEDRGFQFADGVYEVIRLYDGIPFTLAEHLGRLRRSAAGIQLAVPLTPDALAAEVRKFIPRTGARDGMIYLQLTRGVAPRNHLFPDAAKPTLLFYARGLPPVPAPGTAEGAKLWSVADERWRRCWVKAIALLPNVLAKNAAVAAGADEAAFVEDGVVSECSASNLFAVIGGRVVTHPVGPKVLPGITRAVLLEVAAELGIAVDERPPREDEARRADEVFITSTTREISWVSTWNNAPVGTTPGCGPVTRRLHEALQARVRRLG
ncbi:MAG: D-alanine aminotransferase [uncultured Phycisphaerae bacterium]|uniref:D-alanine aminotransferase n=1 Tax=uncultured Phycisphaerae bacterium TaxID=904963 RepID=A0A6J4Q7S7_9BACT|nr:MAG: D-alanine aminotransferase [uncultured Phycisphaerae bacterium]